MTHTVQLVVFSAAGKGFNLTCFNHGFYLKVHVFPEKFSFLFAVLQWLHLTGNAFMVFPTAQRSFPLCSEVSQPQLHPLPNLFFRKNFP